MNVEKSPSTFVSDHAFRLKPGQALHIKQSVDKVLNFQELENKTKPGRAILVVFKEDSLQANPCIARASSE